MRRKSCSVVPTTWRQTCSATLHPAPRKFRTVSIRRLQRQRQPHVICVKVLSLRLDLLTCNTTFHSSSSCTAKQTSSCAVSYIQQYISVFLLYIIICTCAAYCLSCSDVCTETGACAELHSQKIRSVEIESQLNYFFAEGVDLSSHMMPHTSEVDQCMCKAAMQAIPVMQLIVIRVDVYQGLQPRRESHCFPRLLD